MDIGAQVAPGRRVHRFRRDPARSHKWSEREATFYRHGRDARAEDSGLQAVTGREQKPRIDADDRRRGSPV